MPKRNIHLSKSPKIFSPSIRRLETNAIGVSSDIALNQMRDTNAGSTSSFRYDAPGSGIKSTQQINVDYSKFENHTFFNSAESKVNIAFNKIVNEFPFDGTRKSLESFQDSLTGFEAHILDRFPKNVGFLMFSGSNDDPSGNYGTFINVIDSAGSLFPAFSRVKTGEPAIDIGKNSFSIEAQIYPARTGSDNQIICQKVSGSNDFGFMLALSASNLDRAGNDGTSAGGAAAADLIFSVTSGSIRLSTSASIDKGAWNHICAVFDRSVDTSRLKLYVSESLIASSSNVGFMGSLSLSQEKFTIGSGSSQKVKIGSLPGPEKEIFLPKQTFSGAIDEFRFFHNVRTSEDQIEYGTRNIFARDDLKLYFRFNEPFFTGSYGINKVCLDSSGNSLHSNISNFTSSMRLSSSLNNPLSAEDKNLSPILFPAFSKVANLNSTLLSTASNYDSENPNLITRLIPPHYLIDGQEEEGFENEKGDIGSAYKGRSIPGSGEIGSAQLLTAVLLIWAKFFDEIKMMIDHFSMLVHLDYDSNESVAEQFLPFVARYYGFYLPAIYPNAPISQFSRGENIRQTQSLSNLSLQQVQNKIWKRILQNILDITQSKGTLHSVKAIMRAAGIEPDKFFTIREYGGPTKMSLENSRQCKEDESTLLDFSGSFGPNALTSSVRGFGSMTGTLVTPHLISGFLSGSRFEIGFPEPKGNMILSSLGYGKAATGQFIHGISTEKSDGFFTSGSFTYEAIYRFSSVNQYPLTQSLVRIHTTGSTAPASGSGLVLANLIVLSGAQNSVTSSGSEIKLFVRPSTGSTTEPTFSLSLTGVNIFDGNKWSVSFGRNRNDEIDSASSSSYFLRCGRQSFGQIKELFTTASFFQEVKKRSNGNDGFGVNNNLFAFTSSNYNASGSFFIIGSQSLSPGTSSQAYCLNTGTDNSSGQYDIQNLHTEFAGMVGHTRFWSKGLTEQEWKEHVRNFRSLGVNDPRAHFNFMTAPTGAFGRLRLDASTNQAVTKSNGTGNITIVDFSQNNINLDGRGFEKNKIVIKKEMFHYSMLSPKFDTRQSDEKVRVRGFQDPKFLERNSFAGHSPVYDVLPSEQPDDDTRFSIDFSSMRALDEDIVNLFSSLEFFDDALGSPNLLFDEFYPDLDYMREVYFNRLEKKMNISAFFDFFKWFDTAFGALIEQVIPRKTQFLGVNFVIESHMLERHRFRYLFDDIYLQGFERAISAKGAELEDTNFEAFLNAE